ncbi:tyrosine-type recombinase/integrase [Sinirhodobacter sp. WL0062]|uniref:Tyrosine-type recombinase/integrase n=1 Tax=Rhodobacter flavimaris TaxID=2907145 RepID=A0ABS8YVC9_9RHOB|nr:tyrosine-type recombinase/integrase [Sinirhodobacter sp. WL0062]MCE5972453.1 tyrosine-type recombinase/integrase [Sinirhodobacter sp. WL0062]
MKLIRRSGTYYIRKRVPKRYGPIEYRDHVWISLKTDSESLARQKAVTVWADMIGAWEAKLAGNVDDYEERLAAARELSARRGFEYMPAPTVAKLPIHQILDRVESVLNSRGQIDALEAEALLGGVEPPKITVSRALEHYWKIAAPKAAGKSEDQVRRWKNPKMKAVKNFIRVNGDVDIAEITTPDLYDFRAWWWDRIMEEGLSANSANKDLVHLSSIVKTVARAKAITLKFSTEGLTIDEGKKNTRPPFSVEWIKEKILAAGALDGLNLEARCIVLAMVNTGARPSEIAGLKAHHIHLDGEVPYIEIRPEGRKLKSVYSERVIPLAGVSLEAMRLCTNGFPRYFDSPSLSATVNKYLREHDLLETVEHSLYGLRHSFEDRMLAAGVDERIRRDLFGHRLNRERYGRGADLSQLLALVNRIAI